MGKYIGSEERNESKFARGEKNKEIILLGIPSFSEPWLYLYGHRCYVAAIPEVLAPDFRAT